MLSLAGLVLLLVAAWAGDKAVERDQHRSPASSLGACFFLVAPAVCAGASGPDTVAFCGQFRADAFAGFAKLMIYAASGAALVVAPGVLRAARGAMRAEYPVLVLFAALGMSVMVSASDLMTLYIGLELQLARRPTCSPRSCAATRARPRRGSSISCSARSPAASCCSA